MKKQKKMIKKTKSFFLMKKKSRIKKWCHQVSNEKQTVVDYNRNFFAISYSSLNVHHHHHHHLSVN